MELELLDGTGFFDDGAITPLQKEVPEHEWERQCAADILNSNAIGSALSAAILADNEATQLIFLGR
jgi:hypothetical protein